MQIEEVTGASVRVGKRGLYGWDGRIRWRTGEKQRQRLKVLQHLLSYHSKSPLAFFGLPGEEWRFEHELEAVRPGSTFTGVERNYGVFEYSLRHMPGKDHRLVKLDTDIGEVQAARSESSRLLYGELLSLLRQVDLASHTAIWIDGMSPISSDMAEVAQNVWCLIDPAAAVCPFAFTFVRAREKSGMQAVGQAALDRRYAVVEGLLDCNQSYGYKFRPTGRESYVGDQGMPMATLFGVFEKRAKQRRRRRNNGHE